MFCSQCSLFPNTVRRHVTSLQPSCWTTLPFCVARRGVYNVSNISNATSMETTSHSFHATSATNQHCTTSSPMELLTKPNEAPPPNRKQVATSPCLTQHAAVTTLSTLADVVDEKDPYALLQVPPHSPLPIVKLKYLLACRKYHPDVTHDDGEAFLRISLAYEDILKDYGIEAINGHILNLGNFQSCTSVAEHYLKTRAILPPLRVSVLRDYIELLHDVRERIGFEAATVLEEDDDNAMWLIEQLEQIWEKQAKENKNLALVNDESNSFQSNHNNHPRASLAMDNNGKHHDRHDVISFSNQTPPSSPPSAPVPRGSASFHSSPFTPSPSPPLAASTECGSSSSFFSSNNPSACFSPELTAATAATNDGSLSPSSDTNNTSVSPSQAVTTANRSLSASNGNTPLSISDRNALDPQRLASLLHPSDVAALRAKFELSDRSDVAGLAARTADVAVNRTVEAAQLQREVLTLVVLVMFIMCAAYVVAETMQRAKQGLHRDGSIDKDGEREAMLREHVTSDTMLPWWGNDAAYERQVKRIFVEEWRRARGSARRVQMFQEGVMRESLEEAEKARLDVKIFEVTSERVRELKAYADKQQGKQ